MLEFCPVCKKILELGVWKGKPVGRCSCGFIRTSGINISGEEKIENKQVGFGVAGDSNTSNYKNPEGYAYSCGNCGFDKADVKDLGEMLGNEKSVTLFTCLKCGAVDRR